MSYVIEQTRSLIRVLERARTLPDYRLAGYLANIEFWASEIRRCRELLDGYEERFRRLRRFLIPSKKFSTLAHP